MKKSDLFGTQWRRLEALQFSCLLVGHMNVWWKLCLRGGHLLIRSNSSVPLRIRVINRKSPASILLKAEAGFVWLLEKIQQEKTNVEKALSLNWMNCFKDLQSVFTSALLNSSIRKTRGPLLPNKNLHLHFVQVNINQDAKFLSWVFGDTLKKQHLRKNWGKVTERRDIKDVWRGDRYDFWWCSSVGGGRYQTGVKRHDRRGKEGGFVNVSLKSPPLTFSLHLKIYSFLLHPSENPDWAPPTAVAPLRNIYPQMYNSPGHIRARVSPAGVPLTAWSLTPAGELSKQWVLEKKDVQVLL